LESGWHMERWLGVGEVPVPDRADMVRRYPVRDRDEAGRPLLIQLTRLIVRQRTANLVG
jgi:hypothetical protein